MSSPPLTEAEASLTTDTPAASDATTPHISADFILTSLTEILTSRPPGLEDSTHLRSHSDLVKLQRLQANRIRALVKEIRRQKRRQRKDKIRNAIPNVVVKSMPITNVTWEDLALFGIEVDEKSMKSILLGWAVPQMDPVWELDESQKQPLSDWLQKGLKMVRDSVKATNEASVRLMIDLVVLEATASSGTQLGTGNNTSALAKPLYPTNTAPPVSGAPHTNAHSHGPSSLHRPKGRSGKPPPGQQMTLSAEQYLTYTITLTPNSKIKFSGRADYILGYHIPRVGAHTHPPPGASSFLVVIEAKDTDWMQGLCQCLAYMGIVFCTRRKASKTNCTVWGVVSNGDTWVFVRIDNAGKATRSALYDISLPGHLEIVVGFLRRVIKVAAHSSPTTSPTERFLKMFGEKMNRRRWDFGVLSADVLTKREVLERGGYVIEMPRVEEIFKGADSGGGNEAEEGEGTVEWGSGGEQAGEDGDEDGNETEDEDEDDWEG